MWIQSFVLIIVVLALLMPSPASAEDVTDKAPGAPIGRPVVAAGVDGINQTAPEPPANGTTPSVSEPGVLDPTDIYNNLLIPDKPDKPGNLPPQSAAASATAIATESDAPEETFVTPKITDLANGATLSYPNIDPKPDPCVDFNKLEKWASQVVANGVRQGQPWRDHYAGWGFFAVDDPRYYRSQPVAFSFDTTIGNQISAKITSNQPYAAGYGSPLIPVKPGDKIRVITRYLLGNIKPEEHAFDWVSLGIKPDAVPNAKNTVYANGYVRGMWAELQLLATATGDQVMVLLQASSPAAINSNVFFDDVEIFVNDQPLEDCEFAESFAAN